MQMLIWIVPLVLILLTLALRIRKTYKNGLFQALLQLANTAVSAVIAFVVTRLVLDPASMDLFGLGEKLRSYVPEIFVSIVPDVDALARALPTAVAALIAFPLIFTLLRSGLGRLLEFLGNKYHWEKKFAAIANAQKWLALIPGLFSAVLALLVEMVLIGGCIHLAANLMAPAQYAFDNEAIAVAGDTLMELSQSPAVTITDSLGCRWAFEELTTGQRDGEAFSVGREVIEWSSHIMELGDILGDLLGGGPLPDGEGLRKMGDAFADNPEVSMLAMGVLESNMDSLLQSDAVAIITGLMGITPDFLEDYLLQADSEHLGEDMQTFFDMAAVLADFDLLPEEGELFDMQALQDPEVVESVRDEVKENPDMAAFFGIE